MQDLRFIGRVTEGHLYVRHDERDHYVDFLGTVASRRDWMLVSKDTPFDGEEIELGNGIFELHNGVWMINGQPTVVSEWPNGLHSQE